MCPPGSTKVAQTPGSARVTLNTSQHILSQVPTHIVACGLISDFLSTLILREIVEIDSDRPSCDDRSSSHDLNLCPLFLIISK